MSTSKSAPNMPVFNDFDFQIALARRRGAKFVDILDSRSFATPVFRTYLCELSKRQNYGKTQHFAQFLPAKTSLLSNIDAGRPTGNFQYSRKLELLNFLWLYTEKMWIFFRLQCCKILLSWKRLYSTTGSSEERQGNCVEGFVTATLGWSDLICRNMLVITALKLYYLRNLGLEFVDEVSWWVA